jgi:hypothetical protein
MSRCSCPPPHAPEDAAVGMFCTVPGIKVNNLVGREVIFIQSVLTGIGHK